MNNSRLLMTLGAALMAAAAMLGFATMNAGPAQAQSGPCGTANDSVDGAEMELLNSLNSARAGVLGAGPMELSGPINRAAQWHAEHVAGGSSNGHIDAHGRSWLQRMVDCGYTGSLMGSGESLGIGGSASAAFASMWTPNDQHQSGIEAPVNWNCAGVGHSGQIWVVVVALRNGTCPEPGAGTAPPTASTATTTSAAATNTPTNTATTTPTPTPTATPTPLAEFGVTLTVCGGWNLLTIPVTGDVDEVFDTAELAIAAIYLQNGETWLRWAPGVPAYARNLSHVSSGDVLWVYRPEPSCEDIDL